MTLAEPLAVTLEVTEALERLGLAYVVGGSFASSVHGIPRALGLGELLQRALDEAGARAR
jgi:hypothetical protein